MSGGGGGKALAYMINTKPENTILVQSTPLVLRSITRHKGYVSGSGTLSYKDVVPIAGVIGDYGAIAVAKNSPYKNFKDVVDAYKANPSSIKMAGGSVRGSMLPLTEPPAIFIELGFALYASTTSLKFL